MLSSDAVSNVWLRIRTGAALHYVKNAWIAVLALVLSACASWTPTQKKVAYVAGAVVVAAVVVSATDGDSAASYCGDGKSFCGPIRP